MPVIPRYEEGRLVMPARMPILHHAEDVKSTTIRKRFADSRREMKEAKTEQRMGEHKSERAVALGKRRDSVGIDSESEFEPEDDVSSISVGMMPEFVFNIVMFLKFCHMSFQLGIGMTVLAWVSSVESFMYAIYESDEDKKTKATTAKFPTQIGAELYSGIKSKGLHYPLLKISILIIFLAVVMMPLSLLLWHAVFFYRKNKIIIFSAILILLEISLIPISWTAHYQLYCVAQDFETQFNQYFDKFLYDSQSMRKINEVQLYMGCCGKTNFTDYQKLVQGSAGPVGQSTVPFSCCRIPWNLNLYCGAVADDPSYTEDHLSRFNSIGCHQAFNLTCEKILYSLTIHLEILFAIYGCFDIIIIFMVYFIIQKINLMRLEAESLYDFNKLEIYDNTFESDDSAEFDKFTDEEEDGGGDGGKSKGSKKAKSKSLINSIDNQLTLREIYEDLNLLEQQGGNTRVGDLLQKTHERRVQAHEHELKEKKLLQQESNKSISVSVQNEKNHHHHHKKLSGSFASKASINKGRTNQLYKN